MKKLFLSLSLALGVATAAQAQVEIGLKISPSLGFERSSGSITLSDGLGNTSKIALASDGARLHFGGGLVIDYFFGENYAFNTGVELMGKGGTVKATSSGGGLTAAESYKLGMQYVQVPLALKLFTNDIARDTRLYFLGGGQLAGLVGANIDGKKNTDDGRKATKSFNTFDAGVQAGLGAELQLGKSTKGFGGFTYQHGLIDVLDKSFGGLGSDNFTTKNSLVTLDLGLKF